KQARPVCSHDQQIIYGTVLRNVHDHWPVGKLSRQKEVIRDLFFRRCPQILPRETVEEVADLLWRQIRRKQAGNRLYVAFQFLLLRVLIVRQTKSEPVVGL